MFSDRNLKSNQEKEGKRRKMKKSLTQSAFETFFIAYRCDESPAFETACDRYLMKYIADFSKPQTIGIFAYNSITRKCEVMNIEKNVWQEGPDVPEWVHVNKLVAVDGHVFMIGNYYSTHCFSFEVYENKWKEIASIPEQRIFPRVAAIGDRVFAIGGYHDCDYKRDVFVYNVKNDTWTRDTIPPMPTARCDFEVAVVDHRIFCIGGQNSPISRLSTVEVLDVDSNKWMTLPPMKTVRGNMAVAVIGHEIWVIGGWNGHAFIDEIDVYDVDKNEWITSSFKSPKPRLFAQAVVIDGKIWIIGGKEERQETNRVTILDPETGQWTDGPPMKNIRGGVAAALV
jgi:N-acetylneuraminic acid mutarotase